LTMLSSRIKASFSRIGDDGLDVCHLLQHGEGFRVLLRRPLEIGTHPVFEVTSLSRIEDRPLPVLEKIDTRVIRYLFDLFSRVFHFLPNALRILILRVYDEFGFCNLSETGKALVLIVFGGTLYQISNGNP